MRVIRWIPSVVEELTATVALLSLAPEPMTRVSEVHW
jgi:hypothetical protein